MTSAVAAGAKKARYPRAQAIEVAEELCAALKSHVDRIIVAGSLRRRKTEVGDVEILYIPNRFQVSVPTGDLFAPQRVIDEDDAEGEIESLERKFILARRQNVLGSEIYGPKNKLMRHTLSGIPVDLFAATPENWWNYLVCRTGPSESNIRIATEAKKMGWKWNPYDEGFTNLETGEIHPTSSEAAVFHFVQLPCLEPWER